MPRTLTPNQFKTVTRAFLKRLRDEMSSAGCNDLFTDEFPKRICDKFVTDGELFSTWKKELSKHVRW